MPDRWVVDASPLIPLAQAGQLALLSFLASAVVIPEAVVTEVLAGPGTDPARQDLEGGWGTRVAPAPVPARVLAWGLGAEETAAGRQRAEYRGPNHRPSGSHALGHGTGRLPSHSKARAVTGTDAGGDGK